MDIKSLYFVLFLPTIVLFYYLFPKKLSWLVLLLASFIFVAFNSATSALVLMVAIVINFFTGKQLHKLENPIAKQRFLWLAIFLNLILLGLFKYYNAINRGSDFFSSIFNIHNPIPHIEWLLPLGISYYIFQSIGYNIEVYRGNELPENHFGKFAVFLSFFPKIIAGPIERSFNFLPQLKTSIALKYDHISNGCRLILWGVFKKMVVGEYIHELIQPMFAHSADFQGFPLFIAFILYTLEIYVDFSGYTHIAIGSARLFGIQLTKNFNQPFFSTSLTDFWRRWHITLSSWVNDYIFTPLSMWVSIRLNLRKWGIILSVFFSFLLLGIWHGSDMTFALFGIVQGLVLAYEIMTQKWRKKLATKLPNLPYKLVSITLTLMVFTFSCIYFKAHDLAQAQNWITQILNVKANASFIITHQFLMIALGVGAFIIIDHQLFKKGFEKWCENQIIYLRWFIYMLLIFSIIVFSGVNTYPFIYSNF